MNDFKQKLNDIYICIWIRYSSFSASQAVQITNFIVPTEHILCNKENPEPLLMDCEYEIDTSDKGLVLTWQLNGINIYQWIPSERPPYVFPVSRRARAY